MSKLQSLQKYLTLFYLFGQNSYISFTEPNKLYSAVHHFVPQTILFLISFAMGMTLFVQIGTITAFDGINLLSVWVFLPPLSIVLGSIFNRNIERKILHTFNLLIDHFEKLCEETLQLNVFDKYFFKKFFYAILTNVVVLAFKNVFTSSPLHFHRFADTLVALCFLYKLIAALHVSFSVGLLEFVLTSLNKKLQSISEMACFYPSERMTVEETVKKLKSIKNCHIKCYQAALQINKRFGSLLVFFMFESSSTSIAVLFWAFYNSSPRDGSVSFDLARKYKLNFYLFLCVLYMYSCLFIKV